MPLLSLIYVSSATQLLSSEQLLALLQTSRRNNERDGVTGMLLYKDGNIMQAIEGEEEVIHRLHAKILRDSRHCGVLTLLERNIPERQFGDWSMGFQNLADPAWHKLPGYSKFLDAPLDTHMVSVDPTQALKLLQIFRCRM